MVYVEEHPLKSGIVVTDARLSLNALDASNSPVAAGGDYVFTFTTAEALTGLARGEGCLAHGRAGSTGACPVAALALLCVALRSAARGRERRRRRSARGRPIIAA